MITINEVVSVDKFARDHLDVAFRKVATMLLYTTVGLKFSGEAWFKFAPGRTTIVAISAGRSHRLTGEVTWAVTRVTA